MKQVLVAVLAVVGMSGVANADDVRTQPTTIPVPVTAAYIPGGFDSNDRALVVVEGYFPNTCYKVAGVEKTIDAEKGTLSISQRAFKYKGYCLMMMVPFMQTIDLGLMSARNYRVLDSESGANLGDLSIRVATNEAADDYTYAIVRDAYVAHVDGADRKIVLQGELPDDCYQLKEKRVSQDGKNVLTVLPILEKVSQTCRGVRVPFVTTAEIPAVGAGRYLIHVRSLSGESINKLVDL